MGFGLGLDAPEFCEGLSRDGHGAPWEKPGGGWRCEALALGPALSAQGSVRIEDLTGQVRIVGRNLMQVLRAIHRGEAVGIAETEPVWLGLQEMIAALDAELGRLVEGNGPALRERAALVARGVTHEAAAS